MLPNTFYEDEENDFSEEKMPNKTYRLDLKNRVICGTVDGQEALKQAIYKNLNTEFGENVIYDIFGTEKADLIGQDYDYVKSELKDRIREAILMDERFSSVDGFTFTKEKKKVLVQFLVETAEGENIESEVEVNV